MTRARFLVVSVLGAIAAAFGVCREKLRMRSYSFPNTVINPDEWLPGNQYPVGAHAGSLTYTIMQKDTPAGRIYQWRRSDGVAMSPVFPCRDAAIYYKGPFAPPADIS